MDPTSEDRITAPAELNAPAAPNKQKDPKKVAAGRALAARNKEARQALARKQARVRSSSHDEPHRATTSWNWGLLIAAGSLLASLYSLYIAHLKKQQPSLRQPEGQHPPQQTTPEPPRRIME